MIAILRHTAMRLWLTAFAGGVICLWLLPWWQRAAGIHWLGIPSLAILAVFFMILGRGMNYMGMQLIQRHIKEALVWDRAGMAAEAEAAFQKAVALFDSFWLSPLLRRKKAAWFQGALARFYLGPSSTGAYARKVVAGYLVRNPEDADLAQPWLEQLPIYPTHLHEEHAAAAQVGQALSTHQRVQTLLMQFYIASGRMDFDARQTCRRVWQSGQPLSDELIRNLGRMLLETTALSPWALKVYLKAHAAGEAGALEGVAACLRWMPPTEDNRDDLAAAKSRMAEVDSHQMHTALELTERFKPPAAIAGPERARARMIRPPKKPLDLVAPAKAVIHGAGRQMKALAGPGAVRTWLSRITVVILLLVVLGVSGRLLTRPEPQLSPEIVPLPEVQVVTDPFTIQVAAYVSPGEAQRFVDQLVEKGLDAFWTKVASANRTWYQVKVSHFASKAAAHSYGNDLKSKGLIDDFYVANYEPPPAGGS